MALTQVQGGMLAGSTNTTTTIQSNGTTAITIDSSQNVGVGSASSGNKFEVSGSGMFSGAVTTNTTGTHISYQSSNSQIGAWGPDTSTNGTLVFYSARSNGSNGLERMRVTSSGDLYVGTTTGTIGTSNKGFSINGGDGEVRFSRLVGSSSPVMNAYGSQGEARIMGDGDLENTNNRYTGLSDIKFKQNIVDAKSQWADIKAIQVRNYELIEYPDRKQIGVVAQELEQVCPKLVIEREDANGESYKSVAYSVLYMKAVKALQEAMERIETIEAKVEAQAAEIAALKAAP